MKENRIKSCQKCLLIQTYKLRKPSEWHKKSFKRRFNQQKDWRGMFKKDACMAAKHKIILSQLSPYDSG